MAITRDKARPGSIVDPHIRGRLKVISLTQAEYDALENKDVGTLYVIVAES